MIKKNSEYKDDLELLSCSRHLPLLEDVIKQATLCMKRVASVHTVCKAMNSNSAFKAMLPSVHRILRLYLTIPVTSATSDRTFSSHRHIFNYLRSTITEKRLNHCVLFHVHKEITDLLDLKLVAEEFVSRQSERRKYFGSF